MKILIVPGTNFELYYLSSIVCLLSQKDESLKFDLFLPKTIKDNLTPELKSLYSKIDFFKIPALTPKVSLNPAKMIFNIFDNLNQYWKFRKATQKVLSNNINIVCVSGIKEFFANVLCKIAPKNVRLIAIRTANEKIDETDDFAKRPFLSFFLNIKNFLFGYSLMEYKWRSNRKFSLKKLLSNIDNDLIVKNFVRYPYHRTISITDHNIRKNDFNYRLPPSFIALKTIYRTDDETTSILIAGDQTPLYSSWDKDDQKKYEEVFDYLRENFKNYKLLFKPKRGKTDISQYNLDGFEILKAEMCLEEICLRSNIKKVISIRSSSSKVGAYLGITSYLLYPLFKLPKELKEVVENENYDIQSIIRVERLEDLRKDSNPLFQKYDFNALSSLYWPAIINN